MNLETGAKEVIERILMAYGFTSRLQLCKQLGITKSALSNRVFRDSFPADYVVRCALETGASLHWLASGEGNPFPDGERKINQEQAGNNPAPVAHMALIDCALVPKDPVVIDPYFISDDVTSPLFVSTATSSYLIDRSATDVKNGLWIVDIEGIVGLKKIIRMPAGKVHVSDSDGSFDCAIDDIKLIGKVKLTITQD